MKTITAKQTAITRKHFLGMTVGASIIAGSAVAAQEKKNLVSFLTSFDPKHLIRTIYERIENVDSRLSNQGYDEVA